MTGVPQRRPLKVFEVVSTQVRREGHPQQAAGGLPPGPQLGPGSVRLPVWQPPQIWQVKTSA